MRKSVVGAAVILFILLVGLYLMMPFRAAKDKYKVGVLQFTKNNLSTLQGFKDGLRELGYHEGENVEFVFDGPAPSKKELGTYMLKLLEAKPDLIFASPTPAAIVAGKMTEQSKIPVVFAPVNDPVSAGIVKNERAPEGNITGVRLSASDGRRLQSLKDVVPSVNRVFIPYSPGDKSASASIRMLEEAAPKVGVTLVKKAFYPETNLLLEKDYVPENIDAILLPREGLVMSRIKNFVAVCFERKVPLSTPRFKQVEAGALTGYGFNGYEIGLQSARMAHMVFSGTRPSSIPVETSEDYLFINMKTAEEIGVNISATVLRQAHNIVR